MSTQENQRKALADIAANIVEMDRLLTECEKLADAGQVAFSYHGRTYTPKLAEDDEDDWDSSSGWDSSYC